MTSFARWRTLLPIALLAGALRYDHVHADVRTRADFHVTPARPRAGMPCEIHVTVRDSAGAAIRYLQNVHERPMHLIAISADLATFAHVHPELTYDDSYGLRHVFPHAGRYRLFADYTPPGSGMHVDAHDVTVEGRPYTPALLDVDALASHTVDGVRATLSFDRRPVAGTDLTLIVALRDSATGAPVHDVQLYLGALAHFMIASADLADFIHAHPYEAGEIRDPARDGSLPHTHDPALLARTLVGPSPDTIRAVTSLPHAGRHKLWFQFQRAGAVHTVPFVFDVAAAQAPATRRDASAATPRAEAVSVTRVRVGAEGYTPARIELPRGVVSTLEFTRPTAGNCGGEVVIPALGFRGTLPVGGTLRVTIPATANGELPFHCGMDMLQGLIVVR